MKFIAQLLVSTLAVLVTSFLLPGVHINSVLTAVLVAAVLAFLNAVVKPIMIIFTIPVTIFSLGLFLIVINALIILITDKIVDGFTVDGFWWALLFSIVLSFVSSVFNKLNENTNRRL